MPLGNWEGKLHLKAEPEDLPIFITTNFTGDGVVVVFILPFNRKLEGFFVINKLKRGSIYE